MNARFINDEEKCYVDARFAEDRTGVQDRV